MHDSRVRCDECIAGARLVPPGSNQVPRAGPAIRVSCDSFINPAPHSRSHSISSAAFPNPSSKMHKTSSLSELGFFRPVAASSPPLTPSSSSASAAHRRLTKVSVIGAGNVGMAIAQTILTQNLADEIALVAALPDKLRGKALDLQHAAAFLPRIRIVSGTDPAVTKNSDLVVIQIPGETRLNLLQRNVALYRKIVPRYVLVNVAISRALSKFSSLLFVRF